MFSKPQKLPMLPERSPIISPIIAEVFVRVPVQNRLAVTLRSLCICFFSVNPYTNPHSFGHSPCGRFSRPPTIGSWNNSNTALDGILLVVRNNVFRRGDYDFPFSATSRARDFFWQNLLFLLPLKTAKLISLTRVESWWLSVASDYQIISPPPTIFYFCVLNNLIFLFVLNIVHALLHCLDNILCDTLDIWKYDFMVSSSSTVAYFLLLNAGWIWLVVCRYLRSSSRLFNPKT